MQTKKQQRRDLEKAMADFEKANSVDHVPSGNFLTALVLKKEEQFNEEGEFLRTYLYIKAIDRKNTPTFGIVSRRDYAKDMNVGCTYRFATAIYAPPSCIKSSKNILYWIKSQPHFISQPDQNLNQGPS